MTCRRILTALAAQPRARHENRRVSRSGRLRGRPPGPPTARPRTSSASSGGVTTRSAPPRRRARRGTQSGVRRPQGDPQPALAPARRRAPPGSTPATQRAPGSRSTVTSTSSGEGVNRRSSTSRPTASAGRRAVGVQHLDRLDPVEPEQPDALGAVAPALQVPAAVHGEHAHRVDVALGRLVPAGHQVAQVQAAVPPDAVPGRLEHVLLGPGGDRGRERGRRQRRVARRGGELREGGVERDPVVQAGHLGQRPEPGEQGHGLVDGQPQRPGDRVGVRQVDLARLPVGLDEVVGQVARGAADEQQLEVGDELGLGDRRSAGRPRRGSTPCRCSSQGTIASSRESRSAEAAVIGPPRAAPGAASARRRCGRRAGPPAACGRRRRARRAGPATTTSGP